MDLGAVWCEGKVLADYVTARGETVVLVAMRLREAEL